MKSGLISIQPAPTFLSPCLSKMRTRGEAAKDGRMEWQEMSKLSELDMKYTNYGRQILRDSGNLIDSLYQAEIITGYRILPTPAS